MVAFRIEIEKRIRAIAENSQIRTYRASLGKLIRELQEKERLPPEVSVGLMDLVALGNRAAHGVEVDPPAADWVLDIGASIILKLDNILRNQSSHNKANSVEPAKLACHFAGAKAIPVFWPADWRRSRSKTI